MNNSKDLFISSLKDAASSEGRCNAQPTGVYAQIMSRSIDGGAYQIACSRSPTLALLVRLLMNSVSFLKFSTSPDP